MRRASPAAIAAVLLVASAAVLLGAPVAAGAATPRVPNPLAGLRPLTIETVPAIPGARFVLDGRPLVAGPDGTVRTVASKTERALLAQDLAAHLSVATPVVALRPGVRARFTAWYDGGYHFNRTDRSGQILRAAFNLQFLTSFTFSRPNGTRADDVPVSRIRLRADDGRKIDLEGTKPAWLLGVASASVGGHLAVRDVGYTVSSITVDGYNVVHAGQQSFVPGTQHVDLRLLVFRVEFETHDALFGFATGSKLELRYADGLVRTVPLHGGVATVVDLPRGSYKVTVHALGTSSAQSLSVSRDQTVKLRVFSLADIAAVLFVVAVLGAAVLLLARSRRRGRLAPRARSELVDDDGAEQSSELVH